MLYDLTYEFHNQIKFAPNINQLFNEIIQGPFYNLQCKKVLISFNKRDLKENHHKMFK